MAQVTLYLPDEVAGRIRRAAEQSGLSLSAFITGLATRSLAPVQWPPSFTRLYGAWEGPVDTGSDRPPDDVVLP